jgi:hypothetical protein
MQPKEAKKALEALVFNRFIRQNAMYAILTDFFKLIYEISRAVFTERVKKAFKKTKFVNIELPIIYVM